MLIVLATTLTEGAKILNSPPTLKLASCIVIMPTGFVVATLETSILPSTNVAVIGWVVNITSPAALNCVPSNNIPFGLEIINCLIPLLAFI